MLVAAGSSSVDRALTRGAQRVGASPCGELRESVYVISSGQLAHDYRHALFVKALPAQAKQALVRNLKFTDEVLEVMARETPDVTKEQLVTRWEQQEFSPGATFLEAWTDAQF